MSVGLLTYLFFFQPTTLTRFVDNSVSKIELVEKSKPKEYLVIESRFPVPTPGDSPIIKINRTLPDNAQLIPMEKINNVGYTFYLGLIDNPNSPVINDDLKNQITDTIVTAHLPQFLLNNLSIVMTNSLAATQLMYVETPSGWVKTDNFNPDFLHENGLFENFYKTTYIIFLNKQNLSSPTILKDTLTHELGHYIETLMTDSDWAEYYKSRGIPPKTPRTSPDWYNSPFEDFAEVFKNAYTGSQVLTHYGILENPNYPRQTIDSGPCNDTYFEILIQNSGLPSDDEILHDPKLQKCRQENATHYRSIVDNKTKKFVNALMTRINNQ
jgi:hypothetical protein